MSGPAKAPPAAPAQLSLIGAPPAFACRGCRRLRAAQPGGLCAACRRANGLPPA